MLRSLGTAVRVFVASSAVVSTFNAAMCQVLTLSFVYFRANSYKHVQIRYKLYLLKFLNAKLYV